MSGRSSTACLGFGLLFLLSADSVLAQPAITSLQPRSGRPGETTRLTIMGKQFDAALRLATSCPSAEIRVVSVADQQATVDLTLSGDVPLGPLGLWVATPLGPSEPVVLMVDDLPRTAEADDHFAPDTAQHIPTLTAVDGTSDGAKSDYYRFAVNADQRVAFEVLAQPLTSTMDPVVRLLDAAGQTVHLADDDEVGADCRFQHRFAEAGEYMLEVRDNRYAAGGAYHLRVGDFPILRHAYPLSVAPDQQTTVRFAGADGAGAEHRQVQPSTRLLGRTTTVATRLPQGQSSAWVPLHMGDRPSFVEAEPAAKDAGAGSGAPPIPVAISGRLTEPQQRDRYAIQGAKGTAVRIQSRTRSLGCATLLRMRLLNAAGQQVAETAVTDVDEWTLDYTFPDDASYRLEVDDLLGRGGDDFGYCVEIASADTFAINVKADAKASQQFAVEPQHGACALDLQVQRFGYAGAVQVTLTEPVEGLRILNPQIPAGAKKARIYLVADDRWSEKSLGIIGLQGQAVDNPTLQCNVSSVAWQRVKAPHVPFPAGWRDGVILVSGVGATKPSFSLAVDQPLRVARSLKRHAATFTLKRLDEAFTTPVTLLPDGLPVGWRADVKADKNHFAVTWTHNEPATEEPQQMRLLAIGEHQGRARVETVDVPLEWFDPLGVQLELTGPLVAGRTAVLRVQVDRQGDDPQPINLTLVDLPKGISGAATRTVAADAEHAEFTLSIADDIAASDAVVLHLQAVTSFQGQEVRVAVDSASQPVISLPSRLEVFPADLTLRGARDRRQLIVTGYDHAQSPRDWTHDVQISSADPQVAEVRGAVVFPKADGETRIVIQCGIERHFIPLQVSGMQTPVRTAFESEVLVALSKQGCNSGACHGSPSGKGSFRLSLRAFDRELDALTLIREEFGRRVNPIDPQQSLLLQKPLMKISHGGGKRLHPEDAAYSILRDWIAEGAQADPPDAPRCIRLAVFPATKRVLRLDAGPQQVAAVAHFSDGSSRDVTHLVAYESANTQVGTVDERGLVTPLQRGEAVILVRYLEHIESVPLMFVQQVPGFRWAAPPANNYVDEMVNAKLRQMQYVPAETCTDAEFLRRVHLDVIGLLPTVAETQAFLNDAASDKRLRLIDRLLQRDEFAKYWALKWGDLLMMTGKLAGDEGVHKYHRWLEHALRSNMPYDQFARELITASGSTLANPPANFYRTASDMNARVESISQVFLGARLQCAKCHNHPFERWTQDNYYGLGAFFQRVQQRATQRPGETFIWSSATGEVTQPRTGQQMKPWLPGQGDVEVDDDVDRRREFTAWLTRPDNPYFAKMEVNRIWAQLFARGIVDPIDDFRDSNPPANEALLDALARDFVDNGFDRRHVLRTILNSRTYQASYRTNALNRDDTLYFSHQQPRLLGAEQLLDAIHHTMGLQQSMRGLPAGTKATHLPAPDVVKVDFLKTFGQPERSTVCACERADDSNLGMAIELFNGSTVHEKLRAPNNRFRRALAAGRLLTEVIEEVYLAALCRSPSDTELQAAVEHCDQRGDTAAGLEDVCWALLNTDEFLFQH